MTNGIMLHLALRIDAPAPYIVPSVYVWTAYVYNVCTNHTVIPTKTY